MTGARRIAGAGGRGAEGDGRARAIPATAPLCGLLLAAGALLVGALDGPVAAQDIGADGARRNPDRDGPPPGFEAGSPLARRGANQRFGLDTGGNGLPALRGGLGGRGAGLGGSPADGLGADEAGGGGGEGVSRLPRFRTGPPPITGLSASGVSGAPVAGPSVLRQRAAPPRRVGSATRGVTRPPTQGYVTDLRLSPVIQTAVSGVPLPTSVPLPTAIPLLGLSNPARFLFGSGLGSGFALVGRPANEADPAYAPLGIRLGTFTVLPAFTQSIGYDTNPDQTTPNAAKGSLALRSEGEVAFRSDWSASSFSGELRGGYSEFPDNEGASRPNASGATRLRVDIDRDTRFDLETRLLVDTQRTGSPDLGAAATSRPIFAAYGATAGLTENFNRLQVSLRGSIDRQVFEDAQLTDGTTLIQSDRNANQYALRLRVGYEISPTITPFASVIVDTRVYDTPVDTTGFRRDSDGTGFEAGASVTLSRFLAAEVSAGLQHRDYVDRRLRAINAPILNAVLIWQVSPLTTVRFNQTTGVTETSVAGSSGVFTDAAAVEVQHELLRNLSVTVGGAFLSNDYQGVRIRERGLSALARIDYRFNRWLTLRGSYIYQQVDSTASGSSFSDNIFLLGMRVNP